jgi:hypothetical protein
VTSTLPLKILNSLYLDDASTDHHEILPDDRDQLSLKTARAASHILEMLRDRHVQMKISFSIYFKNGKHDFF